MDVMKTLYAESLLDCSQHCAKETTCSFFRYQIINTKTTANCQLLRQTNYETPSNTDNSNDHWTYYASQLVVPVRKKSTLHRRRAVEDKSLNVL